MTATETKSRPITFSGPMIRAILAGQKSQTRREVDPQPNVAPTWTETSFNDGAGFIFPDPRKAAIGEGSYCKIRCPYGVPGDTLWIKCLCRYEISISGRQVGVRLKFDDRFIEAPDDFWREKIINNLKEVGSSRGKWHRGMPQFASPAKLNIEAVRIQRLQEVSEDDAAAELPSKLINDPIFKPDAREYWSPLGYSTIPTRAFSILWDDINGHGAWDRNPFVWCISFKRIEAANA